MGKLVGLDVKVQGLGRLDGYERLFIKASEVLGT